MIFVIGGYAQGKLNYAKKYVMNQADSCPKEKSNEQPFYQVLEAEKAFSDFPSLIRDGRWLIVNNINQWVNRQLLSGTTPEALRKSVFSFVNLYPNCVVISQEVGCGIIPMEKEDRYCREETGRLQIYLADLADQVIRVHCGIGQRLR